MSWLLFLPALFLNTLTILTHDNNNCLTLLLKALEVLIIHYPKASGSLSFAWQVCRIMLNKLPCWSAANKNSLKSHNKKAKLCISFILFIKANFCANDSSLSNILVWSFNFCAYFFLIAVVNKKSKWSRR